MRNLIITFLLLTTIISCNSSGLKGKYVKTDNPIEYFEFKNDKEFYLKSSNGNGYAGNYVLKDNNIMLQVEFLGFATTGTVKHDTLKIERGDYVKQ